MLKRLGWWSLVVCVASVGQAGATPVSSTFDTDVDGWNIADLLAPPSGAAPTITNTYAATYSAAGGNPGGFISASDQSAGDYYFNAPAKFLGNQATNVGGTLSFDVNDTGGNGTINGQEPPIILVGATESIYYPDEATVSAAFTHYSYTLSAGHGGTVNSQGGAAATNADFASVLGTLQAVYILGDRINAGDTASLDNVVLAPEPTSLAMLGAGAALLMRRRVRG